MLLYTILNPFKDFNLQIDSGKDLNWLKSNYRYSKLTKFPISSGTSVRLLCSKLKHSRWS